MEDITLENFNLLSPKHEREKINLDLTRMNKALQKLGNPCINIPAIQIIGTNGKGSISAFLENIISSAGINLGVTTSPHLFNISERIRVNQIKIETDEFQQLLKKIQHTFTEKLSPFELIICCGLIYFDQRKVDLLILEAGLGGRLDATTAHKLRPIIAIGNIGIDHTEYLGDSLEEIAREKAAVIEKGCVVVSCKQESIVENIITNRANAVGAHIYWVKPLNDSWILGLRGNFQKDNAAVALKIVNLLVDQGWFIKKEDIKIGLANTKWSGRLEIINWEDKKILVDSAHNSSAAEVLANERENWKHQEQGVYWIIGVQRQKDIILIINKLIKPIDKVLLVPVPNQESWSLNEISKFPDYKFDNFTEFKDFQDALKYLKKLDFWPRCMPILTGSIFLVSEFIKYSKIDS